MPPRGKAKGKGKDTGRRATSQRGISGLAPTPSGPIAGPSHRPATRSSRRLDSDMASPSASTASALGAGHASLLAPPHSPVDPDDPPAVALNYLVVDNGFNSLGHEYNVSELLTRRIANVMESILRLSRRTLGDINAGSLTLWNPAKPLSVDDDPNQLLVAMRSNPGSVAQRLRPHFCVSKYFNKESLCDDHRHLIVQAPISSNGETTRAKKRKREVAEDSAEHADFHNAQTEDVELARLAPNPSSAAVIPGFRNQQERRPVLNGRPAHNFGPPIGLFHPVFNSFHAIMRSQAAPDPSTYPTIRALFSAFAAIHDTERHRIDAISQPLHALIGATFFIIVANGVKSDGILLQPSCGSSAYASLLEVKNEIGVGHSDPYNQGSLAYRKYWAEESVDIIRAKCCCPTIIIAIAGPWMCVLGGVYLEKAIVQRLTDYIWLGGDAFDHGQLVSASRLFFAIKTSISTLQTYYHSLQSCHPQVDGFPFVQEFGEQKFKYLSRLNPDSPTKLLYKARLDDDSGNPLVVKFVSRYNAEAHRLLAENQLAPSLHYAGTEDPDASLYGGRHLVVMDFVDGASPYAITQAQYVEVKKAVTLLHSNNLVFGDLRPPNILIRDGRVMIIDFDWCGEAGSACYPAELNPDRELGWAPGVQPGSIMHKEHDLFMLEKLNVRE